MNTSMITFYDFTGVYSDYDLVKFGDAGLIDLSSVRGTDMYCDEEAVKVLTEQIRRAGGYTGIHFIDSGNYHYMTRLFTDLIDLPFSLVLFDNHTDMQESMIEGLLSCGNWAGSVLRSNPHLQQLLLIGPPSQVINEDLESLCSQNESHPDHEDRRPYKKILTISREDLSSVPSDCLFSEEAIQPYSGSKASEASMLKEYFPVLNDLVPDIPLYLSIDKDLLAPDWALTNWDQGEMTLPCMSTFLRFFRSRYHILGTDICGEPGHASSALTMQKAGTSQAGLLNKRTNYSIYLSMLSSQLS